MIESNIYTDHTQVIVQRKLSSRNLNTSASIISVGRDLFGEGNKTWNIDLSVTIGSVTFNIVDDEDGNLFDVINAASFSTFKTNNFDRGQPHQMQ